MADQDRRGEIAKAFVDLGGAVFWKVVGAGDVAEDAKEFFDRAKVDQEDFSALFCDKRRVHPRGTRFRSAEGGLPVDAQEAFRQGEVGRKRRRFDLHKSPSKKCRVAWIEKGCKHSEAPFRLKVGRKAEPRIGGRPVRPPGGRIGGFGPPRSDRSPR